MIKRILLCACVLLFTVTTARAADITIVSQQVQNWQGSSAPVLYVTYDTPFTSSDNVFVGSPMGGGMVIYQRVACSLNTSTHVLTIPSITIKSTEDGKDVRTATVSFFFYNANGSRIGTFGNYVNLRVPATIIASVVCSPSGTCCTFADLALYNAGAPRLPESTYYDARTVDQKIAAALTDESAPSSAGYITTIGNSALTGEFALSTLATGILKNTTGTGVPSIAIGSDLPSNIPINLLAAQTASKAAMFDGSGFLASSSTTATELGYVSGVTGNIQAQLNSKGDASTNTASSIDSEVALFSGTGGKTIKRASGTGIAKLTAGVLSVLTDPLPVINGGTGSATQNFVDLSSTQSSIAGAKGFLNILTAPLHDKGGMLYSILSYGALCTGVSGEAATNDTAIANAIAAAGSGNTVTFEGCPQVAISQPITIGNGSGTYSTGSGTTSTVNDFTLDLGGANVLWYGAANGTAIQVNGPISRLRIRNGLINMRAVGTLGLDLNHPIRGDFRNLQIQDNTNGYGIQIRAYGAASIGNGANENTFDNVQVTSTQTGAKGWNIGHTAICSGCTLDVAQTTFINPQARFDTGVGTYVAGSIAFNLNWVDADTMINPLGAAATSLNVVVPSGTGGTAYPASVKFDNPAFTGTTSFAKDESNGTWAARDALYFAGYQTGDGETIPSDTTNTAGYTSSGKYWGVTGIDFSGIGRRITGDLSNGTHANRLLFQTSTSNSNSYIGIGPSGTGLTGGLIVYGWSGTGSFNPDNTPYGILYANGTFGTILDSNKTGSSAAPLFLETSGNIGLTVDALSATPSVVIGTAAALATNATNGFLYKPTSAGAPSGVPSSYTGKVATEYDTTNNRNYFYNGGWRYAPTTTSETGTDAMVRATNPSLAGATLTGSLAFSGSGLRITGDFSNATLTNETMFQSSTTNGNTVVGAIPNGTAVTASYRVYAASDPTNTSFMEFFMNGTFNSAINIGHSGSGTTAPFTIFKDSVTQLLNIGTNGHFTAGDSSTGDFENFNLQGNFAANIGANQQYLAIRSLPELTTIAAAATTTTTIQVPANAIVVGVSVRVTTAIPTATTFTVKIGTDTWSTAAVSTAANSTDPGTGAAGTSPKSYASATAVTITPNSTPASNTGRVRVTIHYIQLSPPTS